MAAPRPDGVQKAGWAIAAQSAPNRRGKVAAAPRARALKRCLCGEPSVVVLVAYRGEGRGYFVKTRRLGVNNLSLSYTVDCAAYTAIDR